MQFEVLWRWLLQQWLGVLFLILVITFLKMLLFVLFFWSFMWFLWNCKCEILLCFITYVNGKKPFMNPQVGSIILFCHLCELKKNHLRICMCVISFFYNVVWVGKITFFFLSFHVWVEKITCKLTNVQYNFFSSIWIIIFAMFFLVSWLF